MQDRHAKTKETHRLPHLPRDLHLVLPLHAYRVMHEHPELVPSLLHGEEAYARHDGVSVRYADGDDIDVCLHSHGEGPALEVHEAAVGTPRSLGECHFVSATRGRWGCVGVILFLLLSAFRIEKESRKACKPVYSLTGIPFLR